jgi:hypothetical protein
MFEANLTEGGVRTIRRQGQVLYIAEFGGRRGKNYKEARTRVVYS